MQLNQFNKVFSNTTNSYKYYWWLSIIEIYQEREKNEISFDEIVLKTISKLWYPVNYFKLSFGKIDQCSKYIKEIQKSFLLKDNINERDLYQFLISHKDSDFLVKITKGLTRYVPYRFIRPWYSEDSGGLKDVLVNSKILELQDETAPYTIDYKLQRIIINKEWAKWINSNYTLIKSFTFLKLIKYLEKENPNTTNLTKKIEKPKLRNLSASKKYWKSFIVNNPNETDIFENKALVELNEVSIDHFLPWSFVTHDLIWNLHPINKYVNSSKSNNIPQKNYFQNFYNLQYNFCRFLLNEGLGKPLEDYYKLFNCSNEELKKFSKEQFIVRIDNFYLPQYEIAKNMGFGYNWKLN